MQFKQTTLSMAVASALLATAASTPLPSGAQEAQQQIQTRAQAQTDVRRHVLDDNITDTPLEMDQLHHSRGAPDDGQQHGGSGGHLPGSSLNVEVVGKVRISNVEPGLISDVGTLGDYAYLGAFGGANCDKGGAYVVDISDPANPTEVGFIPTKAGSFVGEGVQAIGIKTKFFEGDILVLNNEICDVPGEQVGGFSIFNVTDPLHPVALVEGAGDTNPGGGDSAANQAHSAFAWQQGKRAFVVAVDDEELLDVDIFEITDPANPVQIAETGLELWPAAQTPLANGDTTFLHDVVVKKVRGNWLMLLSYWDAGYVVLNVNDPANPVFVNDTDFTDPDPLTGASPAEGNGHQAEFSINNKFILAADEDFSPERLSTFEISDGPNAGAFDGGVFGFGKTISALPDVMVSGPTVFGGYGCDDDVASIPPASVLTPGAGEEKVLVLSRGPVSDPNHPHGACTFDEKAQNALNAGYDVVLIGNHHRGAGAGAAPDAAFCGGGDDRAIFAVCTGHRAMHLLFNTTEAYDVPYLPGSPGEPLPGTLGASILATAEFDGWGYVHLYDGRTLKEIDTYAIPESLDPAFADGFGDLSVHEVATDAEKNRAYISYYSGGFRVVDFGKKGITEVGHYLDEGGNNFWGVQILDQSDGDGEEDEGPPLVLASDRDSGLWIFRYTGDEDAKVAQIRP